MSDFVTLSRCPVRLRRRLGSRLAQVAVLVADAYKDAAIAKELGMDIPEVRECVADIAARLGVDPSRDRRVMIFHALYAAGWKPRQEPP